ncbi:MAG: hypothetical protein COB69_00815 [Phycisphaera sp.]|nr:MAG: hypothetical protein COB69_00815 [Phycisphaera sp.]
MSGPAQGQHADMMLIRDAGGNLVTGAYDFDAGAIVNTNQRVFDAEFDIFGTTDEPGFNALSSGNVPAGFLPLAGNTAVSFTGKAFEIGGTMSNLWHWDGIGAVDFGLIADGTTLNVSKAPSSVFSMDLGGSGSDVAGFDIDTTSADGFLHKHIDFSLINSSGASAGLYLWAFTLENEGASTASFWFVHGFDFHDEPQHEAAVDWVQANLVPTPCLADVNGDGMVTPTDFTAWINAFNNNLPECDQNSDGNCTPTDFTAWIANFNIGCS